MNYFSERFMHENQNPGRYLKIVNPSDIQYTVADIPEMEQKLEELKIQIDKFYSNMDNYNKFFNNKQKTKEGNELFNKNIDESIEETIKNADCEGDKSCNEDKNKHLEFLKNERIKEENIYKKHKNVKTWFNVYDDIDKKYNEPFKELRKALIKLKKEKGEEEVEEVVEEEGERDYVTVNPTGGKRRTTKRKRSTTKRKRSTRNRSTTKRKRSTTKRKLSTRKRKH